MKRNEEEQFKDLMKKTGSPKPSDDFTEKVLREVILLSGVRPEKGYRYFAFKPVFTYIALTLMTLLSLVFYFRIYPEQFNSLNFFSFDNPVWKDTREGFLDVFSTVHVSPLTLMIVGSVVLLIVLDFVLKKIYPKKIPFFFTF